MRAYDLTGQRFGRLTALYKCNYKTNPKQRTYHWHCKCDCGNECDVDTHKLVCGHTKSCGCLQKEKVSEIGKRTISKAIEAKTSNLNGQRFGKLVVQYNFYDEEKKGRYQYCQCDCGNYTKVKTSDLISGNTQSCGCTKSRGQEKIAQILNQYNISFETEKIFKNCIYNDNGRECRFDFYVDNHYIIEYDGIQHFKENSFFTMSLKEQQSRDKFKNEWCKKNNIPIIRIPYTQYNKLSYKDLDLATSDFIINI